MQQLRKRDRPASTAILSVTKPLWEQACNAVLEIFDDSTNNCPLIHWGGVSVYLKTLFCLLLILLTSATAFCETPAEARKKLAEYKIKITKKNFISVIQQNDLTLTKLFLDAGINPNTAVNGAGQTVLTLAASQGSTQIAKALIAKGADVNIKVADGVTPIIFAAQRGHDEILKLLLDNGADPNQKTKNNGVTGTTPLMLASSRNNASTIQLLISGGANINQKNSDGSTALIYAVNSHSLETAKVLINNGSNVNETSNDGVSSLHMAAYNRDVDMVRLLLSNGANINARIRGTGSTPLDLAQKKGYDDIIVILKNASNGSKTQRGQSNSSFVEIADLAQSWEQYLGKTVSVTGYSGIYDDMAYIYEERCKGGLKVFFDVGNISKETYKALGRVKICQERKAVFTILVHGSGAYKMSVTDVKILD